MRLVLIIKRLLSYGIVVGIVGGIVVRYKRKHWRTDCRRACGGAPQRRYDGGSRGGGAEDGSHAGRVRSAESDPVPLVAGDHGPSRRGLRPGQIPNSGGPRKWHIHILEHETHKIRSLCRSNQHQNTDAAERRKNLTWPTRGEANAQPVWKGQPLRTNMKPQRKIRQLWVRPKNQMQIYRKSLKNAKNMFVG